MEPVIIWGAALGSGVFCLGLISALHAKRTAQGQRKRTWDEPTVPIEAHSRTNKQSSTAMSMAAGGIKNGEENFASIGSPSR